MENEEVKFTLSADSKELDKSLGKTLDTINLMSENMDGFLGKIKELSKSKLDNLSMGLKDEAEKTSDEITRLTNKLNKLNDKLKPLQKAKLQLSSEKLSAELSGTEFTKGTEITSLDKQMKPLFNNINNLEGQLDTLHNKWDDISNKELEVSKQLNLIDKQEELRKINIIKQEMAKISENRVVPEVIPTKQTIEDIDFMNIKMHEFQSLIENLDYTQLQEVGSILANDLNTSKTILEDIKSDIAEAVQFGDTKGLIEYENELLNINNQMQILEQQLLQINQVGKFKEVTQALEGLGYTNGPTMLQIQMEKIKTKTEQLQSKIVTLGKRLLTAFSFAAFGTFRRAFSDAIQQSDTAKNKFEAIGNVISTALIPIIDFFAEKIIYAFAWVSKLIYILTGFNIIEKAIARTTKKMNSLGSATKNTSSKMKGLLGGFDEINNIGQQTNTGGTLGGAVGGIENTLDGLQNLQKMFENIKIPWAEELKNKLLENKKILMTIGILLGTVFAVGKLLTFIGQMDKGISVLKKFDGATGAIVAGIGLLIGAMTNAFFNWDTMDSKARILTVTVGAVGGAITAVGIAAKVMGVSFAAAISVATLGIGALVGVLATVIAKLGGQIKAQEELHKSVLDYNGVQEALIENEKRVTDARRGNIDATNDYNTSLSDLKKIEEETGISGKSLEDQVKNGILTYSKMTDEQKLVYDAYVKNDDALKRMEQSEKELQEANKEGIILDLEKQRTLLNTEQSYEDYKNAVLKAMEEGTIGTEDAQKLFEEAMADMDRDAQRTFMEGIPSNITNGLNPDKYSSTFTALKNKFNDLGTIISTSFSLAIINIKHKFDDLKTKATTIATNIGTSLKGVWNNVINWFADKLNWLIRKLNSAIDFMNKIPYVSIPHIPEVGYASYDVGTNFVPNDMIAQIHKGEAIIPEKFNDEKFFGNNNQDMEETNNLLEDIHIAISQLRLVVDRDSIGEASVSYIQQQNRIRGEAII